MEWNRTTSKAAIVVPGTSGGSLFQTNLRGNVAEDPSFGLTSPHQPWVSPAAVVIELVDALCPFSLSVRDGMPR